MITINKYVTILMVGQFYAYGVVNDVPYSYYRMTDAGIGFNSETYPKLFGEYFNYGMFPALLFVAPFADNFNWSFIIGLSAITWGLAVIYQSQITSI